MYQKLLLHRHIICQPIVSGRQILFLRSTHIMEPKLRPQSILEKLAKLVVMSNRERVLYRIITLSNYSLNSTSAT